MPNKIAGPCGGVYVARHATEARTIWVGEAADCFKRNQHLTRLGIEWGVVREMPGSSKKQRTAAEATISEVWVARGFVLCSNYAGGWKGPAAEILREAHRRRRGQWSPSLEHRARISAANRGRKLSPEHRAKLLAANLGAKRSPETCARISTAVRGKWKGKKHSAKTRRKMSRSAKRTWRRRWATALV